MQTQTTAAHGAAPIAAATTDHELAARAAAGDEVAFEAIMRRHNRLLFRTARSILRSDPEVEEALQEAYLRAWRALGSFRSDAKLSTWLTRIVINEALGRLRRPGAQVIPIESTLEPTMPPDAESEQERIADEDPDRQPELVAMRAQMRRLIEARIDLLPDAFRTVFVLRAVEELSVDEVAAVLDIPEATVRTRFFRARSLLRETLSREVDVATGDAFAFAGARCDRTVAAVLAKLQAERDLRS